MSRALGRGPALAAAVGLFMLTMAWTGAWVEGAEADAAPAPAADPIHGTDHGHGDLLASQTPTAQAAQTLATGEIQTVPEVAEGFALQPLAPVSGATVIAFGPGQDLYAATAGGQILAYDVVWSQAGPVVQDVDVAATGFNLPQGIAFDDAGTMYVSDVRPADEESADGEEGVGRAMGRVTQIDPTGDRSVIVDGLPNGQHNTNHIRFGPDGRLYLPNGNPNDHGNGTGTGHTDIFPYSGAFLAIDVNGVDADQPDTTPDNPAILNWRNATGQRIPDDDIVDHTRNDEFAQQVDVFAYGFRNVYGITFAPDTLPFAGEAYTGMNGADDPSSQDSVYRIQEDQHHGFPFCYNEGEPGATGSDIAKVPAPDSPNPSFPCEDKPPADALLGWHVCATGVDFPTPQATVPGDATFPEPFASSLFVGECGPFFLQDTASKSSTQAATTHNAGHKIARLPTDDAGNLTDVRDFVTGLQAPTDVQFGPDGAMYVADADVIYRVFPTNAPDAPEASLTVAAAGQSFAPQVVVVPEDTTVEWLGDVLPHTVTTSEALCDPIVSPHACQANDDGSANAFDKDLGSTPANSVAHTFTEEGVYPYYCKIHYGIGMVGMVIVVDPADPGGVGAGDIRDALGV